jgi:hypothetical protein
MRFMGLGTLHGRLSGEKITRIMYDIGNLIPQLHAIFLLIYLRLWFDRGPYKWLRSKTCLGSGPKLITVNRGVVQELLIALLRCSGADLSRGKEMEWFSTGRGETASAPNESRI